MKTLRELADQGEKDSGFWGTRAYKERKQAKLDAVLGPYGDWRVVEGVLHCDHDGKGIHVHEYAGVGLGYEEDTWVSVGAPGKCAKLILPPEEKEVDLVSIADAEIKVLKAHVEASRGREDGERRRADRYEKRLREIAEDDVPGMWRDVAERRARMAREALDENESD